MKHYSVAPLTLLLAFAIPGLSFSQPAGIPPSLPRPPVNVTPGTTPTTPGGVPATLPPLGLVRGSQNGLRGLDVADQVADPNSLEGRTTARTSVMSGGNGPEGGNAGGPPLTVPPAINPFEAPAAPPVLTGPGGNPVGAPPAGRP